MDFATMTFVNVKPVTWANTVKQHFVILNVWTVEIVRLQQFVPARMVIKDDIAKVVFVQRNAWMVENAYKRTPVNAQKDITDWDASFLNVLFHVATMDVALVIIYVGVKMVREEITARLGEYNVRRRANNVVGMVSANIVSVNVKTVGMEKDAMHAMWKNLDKDQRNQCQDKNFSAVSSSSVIVA